MRHSHFVPLLLILAAAAPARASSPKIWVTDSTKDFSTGTTRGVSALPGGALALTRASEKVAGLAATKIFAVASEKSGALLFGAGDEGEIYRAEPGKPATLLLTLPESEVTALAIGPDGALYAGTSPRGKVYRIEKGKALVFFEPKAEYIWSLAFGDHDTVYVATGIPGRIFRVTAPAEGTVFLEAADEHVRCLYRDSRGWLWAGTSGKGLLLRVAADGTARTIYDSDKAEISALAGGPDGEIWAAAVSTRTGASAPASGRPPTLAPPKDNKKTEPGSAPGGGEGDATVTVTATTSLVPPATPSAGTKGGESSEVVEVLSDDSIVPFWKSDDELVYSCRYDSGTKSLLVATGPHGRVYFVRKEDASLAATVDEKRVVLASDAVLVTDSPAAVYRRVPAREGEYFSTIKDTGRLSRFGSFRAEDSISRGGTLTLAFRSGNSSFPDATWSPWTAAAAATGPGKIGAPPGRFLQWKAAFAAESSDRSPRLTRVECAYQNENARPRIEAVAVGSTGREASSAFSSPSTEEGAAEGVFGVADEKNAPSRPEGRGYLVVTWKAADPDGDELVADVDFRPSEGTGSWIAMRRGVHGNSFGFDSRLLPDGRYLFRVAVSDRTVNPDDPRSDSATSDPVLVDNTPPAIAVVSADREKGTAVLRLKVADALSPLSAVGWSVNAGPWQRAVADDGMTDSREESYTISLATVSHGAYVLVRAVDAAGNSSSFSIAAP